jgi:hypothetical protein
MLLSLFCSLALLFTPSHQHGHDRAAHVMGFDQEATTHHFRLYEDGGAIEVTVKDAKDSKNTDAIRGHLSHIAMMFADGRFDAPMMVHDTADVPGTAAMAAHRAQLTYRYTDTPRGGRIDIVTTDPAALEGVHGFLRYQIREHRTGDSGSVEPRR